MDDQSLTATKKKEITIDLYLAEVNLKNCIELENSDFNDQRNRHICSVLGIEWKKEEVSKYFVKKALFKNKDCLGECWTKNHPKFLPLSNIPNPMLSNTFDTQSKYKLRAPTRFPAAFVEQLKKNKSITLEPNSFQEPVTIIFKLVYTKKCSSDREGIEECCNEFIKGSEEKLDYKMEEGIEKQKSEYLKIKEQLRENTRLLYIVGIGTMNFSALVLFGLLYSHNFFLLKK
jgi:hypothetical protein